MMDCKHAWVVYGMAEIDDALMETQGHLSLSCAKCGAHARLERPTYFECYLVTKGWVRGEETCFTDSAGGDDRLVIVREGTHADDLLTAGDDDQIDPLGTMGWTLIEDGVFNDDAAADFRAHIFDGIDQAPAECDHTWYVRGVAGEEVLESEIELYCLRCHEWATVPDLTDYECGIIGRAWLLGLALEWQDTKRVQLHRDAPPANGQTSIDDPTAADDQPRPPVADLVDVLDLFEGEDDEDIPF